MADKLEEGAKLLLKLFINLKGSQMSDICLKSINNVNWLKVPKPCDVRDEIKEIVEYVEKISEQTNIYVSYFHRIFISCK